MDSSASSLANTPALQTLNPAAATASPPRARLPDAEDLADNGAPNDVHPSAAHRVFAVTELRDIILEALLDVQPSRIAAVRDLVACAAVNSLWAKSVMDSISIPARIFRTAPRPDACRFIDPDEPHPGRDMNSGSLPTIYGRDGPAECLHVHRDDLQFNPVLDDVLALSRCIDKSPTDEYRCDGIFVHANDICHPCIATAQRTALNHENYDFEPTAPMKGVLAEHSGVAEHIRDELMDWMDEQPILTRDIPCWTPNDLTAPIFRNMFLTYPPVTEIVVYFGTDNSHNRRDRFDDGYPLCRARLSCDDGVKIGHLIIALASYHTRIDWSCSDVRRLVRDSERPPPGIVGRVAWRFDDLHSIEVAYNLMADFKKGHPFVDVSRECEGVCEHAEDT
ncbi:hypothetical protein SLS56_008500 [Neofusicoccum ribis]|uniref:F-box domain-containing protein n=1 Tax=Neofusicoccum ribis TaxID=45134 RepID=A0ABR3SKS1_9PEZI